jgi:hypothetical protein
MPGNPSFRDVFGDEMAEEIAALANKPGQSEAARKVEQEQADAARASRRVELAALVVGVQRGSLGRHKEATVCIESLNRLLNGIAPRDAETAILITCESIVREAKERIRKAKRTARAGRGAP